MTTRIYYFSGTGNSLAIARELEQELDDCTLSPIVEALMEEEIAPLEERVGLVFPIHAFTMPAVVREFLEKADLSKAQQIFAVAARKGSPCMVFQEIDKLLAKQEQSLLGGYFVNMMNNYIVSMPPDSEKRAEQLQRKMVKRVKNICYRLEKGEKSIDIPRTKLFRFKVLYPILSFIAHITGYLGMVNRFYADKKCDGCGSCTRACPANRIHLIKEGPDWDKSVKCHFCLACLHYCRAEAIQVRGSKSTEYKRCPHPDVSMADIAGQR